MKKTMLMLLLGVTSIVVVVYQGCGGGGGGPGVKIAYLSPADGATDVPGGTNIIVGFSKDDGSTTDLTVQGEIGLQDASGNSVSGDLITQDPQDPSKPFIVEVKEGAKTVKYPAIKFDPYGPDLPFSPDKRLAPNTQYTLTIRYNGKTEKFSFTTSSFGSSLTIAESELKNKTYILDLAKATVEEPPKLFDFVQQLASDFVLPPILLNVLDVSNPPGKIKFLGGLGCIGGTGDSSWCSTNSKTFGEQDESNPVLPFPLADLKAPFFVFGPQDFGLIVAGAKLQILGLTVGGIFAPDGSSIGEGLLQGIVDVKEVAAALGDASYADVACQLLPSITGRSCKACPAPRNYNYCIDLKLTNIPTSLSGSPFKKIIAPVVTFTPSNATTVDVTVTFKTVDDAPIAGETIRITVDKAATISGTGCTTIDTQTIDCPTDPSGQITGVTVSDSTAEEVTINAHWTGTTLPPVTDAVVDGDASVTFPTQ